MKDDRDDNLAHYLSNHLAGSVAGVELVKMMISENRGKELAPFLQVLLKELEEDQEVVRRCLKEMGRRGNMIKEMGAWTIEKLAFSPLTGLADASLLRPVVELEGILIGTLGRHAMWRLLERFHQNDPRFAFVDFTFLRERAERQAEELERHRQQAGAVATAR
ncbi:hypothetical protein LPW11_01100 [Geomonas sp. RF6]|uniref:hypothetical protein n=1 Tax=Geomonas sp. RF6 TaxID=2897342 RepID=UPI001E3410B4|nr:hypothetical protein [Geomonas sp. RF6]UFS70800.1 hypothetical protein LPW11_01100 [Geomonas sp. RF6]